MIDGHDNQRALAVLSDYLLARTGQQIKHSGFWRIELALSPVLKKYHFASFDILADRLRCSKDPELERSCTEAMLNNESFFFRDNSTFKMMAEKILPWLNQQRDARKMLRIWSAGCSSGQEIYSVAMLLRENWHLWKDWHIELLASDISSQALERARQGKYMHFEIQRGLPAELMIRYFDQQDRYWMARPEIRNMISFREENILETRSSQSAYDLIMCRNVLMYFSPENREIAYQKLANCLRDDGLFLLGASETVIGQTDIFAEIDCWRGYYELGTRAKQRKEIS